MARLLRSHPLRWTLLLATIPLLGWWTYGLFDLDEGFYAAVTGEMNRRGEWIIPYFNGHPWFEKPILLYWVAKPCVSLFGIWIGPRLPSVLATVTTYALIGGFTGKRFGALAAVLAVLVLASSILVAGLGRMMMTDPLLDLALTGAFLTFWESLEGDPRWRIVSAFCLGAGVLAKGPVACALFLPPAIYTYFRWPSLRPRFRGWWLVGTIVLAAVVAAWYLPAYLEAGQGFVKGFLIDQNIGRMKGTDEAHNVRGLAGLVYYIPIILVGFAPWCFYLWSARRGDEAHAPLRQYCIAWMLTVFLFFTASSAKLPHYVLPMGPPLSILVGSYLASKWDGEFTWRRLAWPIGWTLTVAVLLQFAFSGYYYGLNIGSLDVPGFHHEVQQMALYARQHRQPGEELVEYQMGRQSRSLPNGKPSIQENEQPSTVFYFDDVVNYVDDYQSLLAFPKPCWVITRWNRLSPDDLSLAGKRLKPVAEFQPQNMYRLYRWQPRLEVAPRQFRKLTH